MVRKEKTMKREKTDKHIKHNIIHTLGKLSTGTSTLMVLFTISPDEPPWELSQFCADEGCNKPDICISKHYVEFKPER